MPAASTTASVKQPVGMTDITLDYSRPSAKGRKVMGELVPFGAIWRTGANQPTKFTTTDSLTVAGKGLPKGTYVIMTKPGKDAWEVMFNKNPEGKCNGRQGFVSRRQRGEHQRSCRKNGHDGRNVYDGR